MLRTLFQRLLAVKPQVKSVEEFSDRVTTEEEVAVIKAVPPHLAFNFTERLTEALAWPAQDLPPLNRAVNTNTNINGWTVGPVNMSNFKRALGKLTCGAGTTGFNTTVSFLCGCTSNTSCTAYTNTTVWTWTAPTNGASVTVLGANTNSATVEIRADQMTVNTNYLMLLVNNNCAQLFAAELIASQAVYSPASNYNNTTTLQQAVT